MQSFRRGEVELAYDDLAPTGADRGEPIVLVHGFASNAIVNWAETGWTRSLTHDGRRTVVLDNRGHGASAKLTDPTAYDPAVMAGDVAALMDHLSLPRADVMGYSMGARIAAHLALAAPLRVRSLVLGGLGIHLVDGAGLPLGIADAMEAPSADAVADPAARGFRSFAERTRSDLPALAACIRGSRRNLARAEAERIAVPTLVAVGTRDGIAGDPHALAALIPGAEVLPIEGRDHNLAVGDRGFKAGVLAFLARRP